MAGVLIGLALLAFWLFSLFDVITAPEEEVRNVPKALWILIVVLIPLLGGLIWMLRGRPKVVRDPWPVPPGPGMPKGPDDDPDFLKDLDKRMRGED
ncbi:MAG: PLDc_N domain-containing protein [Nonomuraea sp.]|nr:PLDc_N domain-containing protein [Nonomuraea sp.]NUP69345.1 PLDc_N domain-containing protein [Nonomuraea sp.]NUP77662.1 PLDc_N domain-containing protein [Nonomuraea sp.]NUS03311.1 PLDc_N domain-containing protein [Nonomuraea sp.]NUT10467.1 PLDc_N domain-containing protein [Nonomuraea sp.]